MEDRHLCKAKRTDTGEWVEGFYVRCRNHDCILPIFNDCEVSYGYDDRYDDFVEVDPSTICQCTGLKDKNGKLIWENDITLRNSSQGLFNGKIVYDKNGCLCHREFKTDFEALLIGSERYIEVVGNIFNNPELLEVRE